MYTFVSVYLHMRVYILTQYIDINTHKHILK